MECGSQKIYQRITLTLSRERDSVFEQPQSVSVVSDLSPNDRSSRTRQRGENSGGIGSPFAKIDFICSENSEYITVLHVEQDEFFSIIENIFSLREKEKEKENKKKKKKNLP